MDMNQLTRIFCEIDDFCKELNQYVPGKFLPSPNTRRGPTCCLSDSDGDNGDNAIGDKATMPSEPYEPYLGSRATTNALSIFLILSFSKNIFRGVLGITPLVLIMYHTSVQTILHPFCFQSANKARKARAAFLSGGISFRAKYLA